MAIPPRDVTFTRAAMPPAMRLPRATGPAVTASDYNTAAQMLERADAASVKTGTLPSLLGVVLQAPGGASWVVQIDDLGRLQTVRLDRTT